MNTTQIDLGSVYYLELLVTDNHGDPLSGLSVSYSIHNSINETVFDSGILADIGNGIYKKSITFNIVGQYRIIYTTPINYSDEIEVVLVKEVTASDATVRRILGLCQENYRIFNPTYDKNNNLIGGIIKIYPTSNDVDTDTNSIASYSINASFDSSRNLMKSYKVKRTA